MSFTHQSLAWNLDLPSAACKLVLMGLASYANEDGYCYPGQATLAQRTCQTERSVRTHLAWLEDQGFIKRQHRGLITGRTSDEYLITISTPKPENISATQTGKIRHPKPENISGSSIYESVSKNNNARDVQKAAETLPEIPSCFGASKAFADAWASWVASRKEMRKPITPRAAIAQFANLSRAPTPEAAAACINESIANGWQGLFPPKEWASSPVGSCDGNDYTDRKVWPCGNPANWPKSWIRHPTENRPMRPGECG